MLEFSDIPYQFYPAKPNTLIIWLGRLINKRFNLPSERHLIKAVDVRPSFPPDLHGKRLMFVANHSTHSDPQIVTEVQRQLGLSSCFMAAYDVFERNKLISWVMQHAGCFSVNRDGSDGKSMKEAIRILSEGRHALTLFPEGNVYLMNDRVTPFLDGAAFIALKAQKQLGPDLPIHVVPLSIKATHLTDQREAIFLRMECLAKSIGIHFDRTASIVGEVKRVGVHALERTLRQRGRLPKDLVAIDLPNHLEHCAQQMIELLELKMALTARANASLTDRIRNIRAQVHKIRTDESRKADHGVAMTWADEAMVALRVLSYGGNYLDEKPSLDRLGETVEKLLEDVFSEEQPPHGNRQAYIRINKAINVASMLDGFKSDTRTTIQALTQKMEMTIQNGLNEINATNSHPGSKYLEDL